MKDGIVYVLFERHTKDGEIWFKTARKRPDIYISDEWYKVNEVRCKRLRELEQCANETKNFKSKDFCDENYSIMHRDGLLIELIIEKRFVH